MPDIYFFVFVTMYHVSYKNGTHSTQRETNSFALFPSGRSRFDSGTNHFVS